jgi:hypothetical protein
MPSGLVLDGKRVLVPGLTIWNWFDNPVYRLTGKDVVPRRTSWVRQVIVHSSKGVPGGGDERPQVVHPGLGPSVHAGERFARFWSGSDQIAGAHLAVDHDGEIFCFADLVTESAQHAGLANDTSVGVEIYEGGDADFYEGQFAAAVALIDAITLLMPTPIQRQIPHRYVGPSRRLMQSMTDVVGVLGHRDLTNRRGPGDPGGPIMSRLGAAGFELVDFDQRGELELWRRRQRDLGITADGIPGAATAAALRAATAIKGIKGTRPAGLWVIRPGDPGGPPYPAPF